MTKFIDDGRNPSEIPHTRSGEGELGTVYRFGDVEVDPVRGRVTRGGRDEPLRPRAFEVLLALIRNRGRTMTKEELLQSLWIDVVVAEEVLVQCVVDIRRAIGDDPKQPRFIKTLPKVGYRFIGKVEEVRAPAGDVAVVVEEDESVEMVVETRREGGSAATPALAAPSGPPPRLGLLLALLLVAAGGSVVVFALRHPPPATALPHLSGRRPVTVLLFENESGRGDLDWLREGLTDMVVADLSSSGRLSVLSRQQLAVLLERTKTSAGRAPSLARSVELARRSGADAFVLGSFTRLGQSLRVTAQLHDGTTGALLLAESATAARPELVFDAVDALAGKLVARLTDGPAATPVPGLATAMTGNLEAYRLYSLALSEMQGFHTREAIDLLTKAAALDPAFVMARARMGYVYAVIWDDAERGRQFLEAAFRESNRLTEKDREQIAAWYAIARRDYPSAIRTYRELVRSSPKEVEGYYRLAELLAGESRWEEALAVAREALAADPESGESHNLLAARLADVGRNDEALAAAQRYVELEPAEPNARDTHAGILQRMGRYDEAIAEYREALRLAPDFEIAVVHLGNVLLATGRVTEAIEAYRRYLALADSDTERRRGRESLAAAQLRRGRVEDAEREFGESDATRLGGGAIRLALQRRDFKAARDIFQRSYGFVQPERGKRETGRLRAVDEGAIALRGGDAEGAVAFFAEALRHRAPNWHFDTFEDCLANAYLELRRYDEAIAEYERILRANPRYPLARYRLGLAYDGKGDGARARLEWARFLETWKDADADLPEVVEAKRRLGLSSTRPS